ncbi:cation transporter [Flavobacterium arcticum]|uniref:Cation transporter n=1 Tax=Flavobacterium arcticum TaxID=1784713 RepID=A0A345HBZ3_9FLAO|nr:heavy-metal-associated domain-containing protein [Flavobacterium arcticum]AXG74103.1 cation transporter [Flavobacterium arcticum]KAF2507338.1 heavy-metal-associated domain-containing protein [Flavobacterium arcticum]
MNLAKNISLFAVVALLSVSCKNTAKEAPVEGENEAPVIENTTGEETVANLETTTFNIDGMTCAIGCAKVIENKLAGLDGVQEAKVDFDNKTATVSFDAGKQTPEALVETVEHIADGAYKVSDVKNSGDKAQLYKADQEPEKKKDAKAEKKAKKAKTSKETKSAKKGCCSGASKCGGEKEKAGSL